MRELDRRTANGLDVRLVWRPEHGDVFVEVRDEETGEEFTISVAPHEALEAFHHPYAYAGPALGELLAA